jgi:hypothetical protein
LFFLNVLPTKATPLSLLLLKWLENQLTLIEKSADSGLIGLKRIPYTGTLIE